MRRSWPAALGLSGLLLAGCGDDGTERGPTASEASSTAIVDDRHPYVLLDDPAWTFVEAVDYLPDSPFATIDTPHTDWFVEYDHDPVDLGGGAVSVDHVSVAALEAPLDETASHLETFGYATESVPAGPWTARGTLTTAGSEYAAVVLLDGDDRTIQVLSYDLDVHALAAVAARLQPVDEAAWRSAGGVVQ